VLLGKEGHEPPCVGNRPQFIEVKPLISGAPPEGLHDRIAEIDLHQGQDPRDRLRLIRLSGRVGAECVRS
jgi:hypothetical protein